MNLSTEVKIQLETTPASQNQLFNLRKVMISTHHTPNSGLNELVDHAAAIFSYTHLLTQNSLSSDIKKSIYELLETLQQHYQKLDYSQDIILAAHYIVCATLDDIIRCIGGNDGQYLQNFHNSRIEQEKFYSILEHISPQADKYLDLLELIYLCLRFGYKGQYRNTPFGLQQWSLISDTTYRIITQSRGQHSHTLSPTLLAPSPPEPIITRSTPATRSKKRKKFYFITASVFIVLAIATGLLFRQTYNTTRELLITHDFISSNQPSGETP